MNFKDKRYYIRKLKEFVGIVVVCTVVTLFLFVACVYGMA